MNKVSTNSWIKFDVEKTTEACTVQSSCGLSRKAFTFFSAMLLTAVFLLGAGEAWGQTKLSTTTDPQLKTASGEYQAPDGYRIVKIECWGGGGAGQSNSNSNQGGGYGGGGGGYARVENLDVTFNSVFKITIGAGGDASSNDNNKRSGGKTNAQLRNGTSNYTYEDYVWATGGKWGGSSNGAAGSGDWKSGLSGKAYTGGKGGTPKYQGAGLGWGRYSGGGGSGAGSSSDGKDGRSASGTANGDGGGTSSNGANSYVTSNPGGSSNKYGGGGKGGGSRNYMGYVTNEGNPESGHPYGGGGGGTTHGTPGSGAAGCVRFTLEKIEMTITANSSEKVYDGSPLTDNGFTVSYKGTTYTSSNGKVTLPDGFEVFGEIPSSCTITDVGSVTNQISVTIKHNGVEMTDRTFITINNGSLKITKRPITLTSASKTWTFDGQEHYEHTVNVTSGTWVSGEGVEFTNFSSITHTGSVNNEFTLSWKSNTKESNYDVTKDYGTLTINQYTDPVVVTITEHSATKEYNGQEQEVKGYDFSPSVSFYTTSDYTFNGTALVSGTACDNYHMQLVPEDFTHTNTTDFADVTFIIVDGSLTITPRTGVVVTVTEHGDELNYDGQSHTVSGYEISCNDQLYNTSTDMSFSGTSSVSGTAVGTYSMNLQPNDFTNANTNFSGVVFNIVHNNLNIYPQFTASVTPTDITCHDESDGSATITVSGGKNGNPRYYYSLDNGASIGVTSDFTLNNLSKGNHEVVVTDLLGNEIELPFTINEPEVMSLTSTITPATCPGTATGKVVLTVVGGNDGNYQAIGNLGTPSISERTITFSNIAAGNYFVAVMDSKGCSSTSNITIGEPKTLGFETCTRDNAFPCPEGESYVTLEPGTDFLLPVVKEGVNTTGLDTEVKGLPDDDKYYAGQTYSISYIISNSCGEKDTCSFEIAINDQNAPNINCPDDVTTDCISKVATLAPLSTTYNEFILNGGTVTGNYVDLASYRYEETSTGDDCHKVITRKYFISNYTPVEGQCVQSITVDDNELPAFTTSTVVDLHLACDASNRNTTINNWLNSIEATDNYGTPTITNDFLTLELPTSGCGEVTVTFTATDNCNNSNEVTAKIILEDDEAPQLLSGKSFPTGQTNMNACYSGIPAATSDNEIKALYTDNSGNVIVSHTETVTGTDCSWTATYVYTISDLCNHSFQETITYSGGDNSAPVVVGTVPTQNPTVSNCVFTIPDVTELVRAITSDNCTDNNALIITQSPEAGASITLDAAAREDNITVTVKDLCDKQTTTTVKVAVPAALSVTATASQNTVCKSVTNSSVQLSANVQGGTAPYQYAWSPVTESTSSINVSPTDTTEYTLNVKDANNCESNASVTVYVLEPKIILASFEDKTICAPGTGVSSVALTAVPTEQKGTVTYAWSPEAGLSATSGQTVTASPTVTTYYTVVATAELDGCQTTDTKTVKVTVKTPVVVLNSVNNVTSCAGNEVVMSANTALYSGDLSWKWTLNNDSVANTRNYEFTPSVTEPITEYQFAVTATVKDGNCSTSDSKQVTLTVNNPIITLADILDTTICIGGSAPLKAIATANYSGVQYVWSPAYGLDYADRAEVMASPNGNQTYMVVATLNIGNCHSTDNKSVTVTVNNPYVTLNDITSNQPDTICAGPDVTLAVSYNEEYTNAEVVGESMHVTYAWSSSNSEETITSTDATITVHPLVTTTYTVTATAHEGVCTSTDVKSYTVHVQSPVSIAFVNDADAVRTLCAGAEMDAVVIDHGHASLKMEWTNEEIHGIYLVGDQILGNTQVEDLTAEQTYPYYVVAISDEDNPKCPTDTIFGTVSVRPLPKVNLVSGTLNPTVCSGETIDNIVFEAVNAELSIEWTGNHNGVSSENFASEKTISGTPVLTTETAPTQYAYTVTATSEFTDPSCGTTPLNGVITVNPLSTLTVGENRKQSICFEQPIEDIEVLHDANSTVRVTGLPNGVTYKEAEHKISGTPYSEGQYVYTVMATSNFAHACDTLVVTDTITVKPLVTLAAATNANPSTCEGVAMSDIRINYSNATLNIEWKNDQNVIIDQPADLDTNMTVTSSMIHGIQTTSGTYTITGTPATAGIYTYTLTATSTVGCEPRIFVGTVTVSSQPQLAVTSGNAVQTVCAGQPIQTIEISHPNSTLSTPNVAAYGLEFYQVTADSATISGTPTATANFNLSASNNCGTADLIPVGVTVNALPTITITNADQTVCKDEAIVPMTITVTNATVDSAAIAAVLPAGLSYSHSTGRITGAPTMAKDSTFTVTATSNLVPNCGTTSAVITLHVNPLVTMSVTNADQTLCLGESIQPIKVSFSNADLAVPEFAAESGLSYHVADSTITGSPVYGGTYTYTLAANSTFEHACIASTQTITVTVHDTLPLTISSNRAVCVSSSLSNNVLSLSTNNMLDCSYVWTVDGGTVESGDATPSINVSWSSMGTKLVTVTVTNNTYNCVSHATKSIDVEDLPALVITEAPAAAVCPNVGSVPLVANASGGAGRYTFAWTSDLQLEDYVEGRNSYARVTIPSVFCDTLYHVGVKVTDGNGCAVSTNDTTITVKDLIRPNISNVELLTAIPDADHDCSFKIPDFSGSVTAEDNCGGMLTITQTPAAGTSYQQTNQIQTIPVTVTVADICGNSASETITVTIPRKISVRFNSYQDSICEGSAVELVSTVEDALGEVSYQWIPTTGLEIINQGDKARAMPLTTQTYYLNVKDQNRCTASDVATITVISAPAEFSFNCIGTLEYLQNDTLRLSRGLLDNEVLTWTSSDETVVRLVPIVGVDTAIVVQGRRPSENAMIRAYIVNNGNPEACRKRDYFCEVEVVEDPIYLTCPNDMEAVYDRLPHKADSSLITTRARNEENAIVPIDVDEIYFQISTDNLQWSDPIATMPSITNVFDGPLFVKVSARKEYFHDASCRYKMTITPKPVTVTLKDCQKFDGTPLETPLSKGVASDPDIKFASGMVTTTSYVGGKYTIADGTSQLSSQEVVLYEDDVRNYDISLVADQYIVRPIISGIPANQCPLPEGGFYTLSAEAENISDVTFYWNVTRDGVAMSGLEQQNTVLNIPSDGKCHIYEVSLTGFVSDCEAEVKKIFEAIDEDKPNIFAIHSEVRAIPIGECKYIIPDLTDTTYVWCVDNCTEKNKLILEQDATGIITESQNVKVSVRDMCGNINSVLIMVTIPEELKLSNCISTEVLCKGDNTGTVTVDAATGGTPGYTYSINNPNAVLMDRTFSGLGAGTYTVTVVDNNYCSDKLDVTVQEPEDIAVGTAEMTSATCANNDGKIVVSGTRGGVQNQDFGYFYNLRCEALQYNQNRMGVLNNLEGSVEFDHLPQGVYTLTVRDANGCEKQLENLVVGRTSDLTVTMPDTLVICSGGDVRFTPTVAPGANGYMPDVTYSWSCGGRGAADVRTITDIDLVNAGNTPVVLTYYVTASNINCTLEDSVKVVVNPTVVISTQSYEFCSNEAGYVEIIPTFSQRYSALSNTVKCVFSDDTTYSGINAQNQAVFTVHVPNAECKRDYTYTIIYLDNAGCRATATDTIHVGVFIDIRFVGDFISETTVECSSEAVAPHTLSGFIMPTALDGCDREIMENPVLGATPEAVSCEGDMAYTYTYTDCSGRTKDWTFTYHIVRTTPPTEFVAEGGQPKPTTAMVEYLSQAVAPASNRLPDVRDVCGNAAELVRCDTVTTNYPCENTRTYTYTYKDCVDSIFTWSFIYTIIDTTAPDINTTALTMAQRLTSQNCEFRVPDLKETVRVQSHDNVVAQNHLIITQTPTPDSLLLQQDEEYEVLLYVTVKDSCDNDSTVVFTLTVPAKLKMELLSVQDITCQNQGLTVQNGSLSVQVFNGTAPYSTSLIGGSGIVSANNNVFTYSTLRLPSGHVDSVAYEDGHENHYRRGYYTVMVVDDNRCKDSVITPLSSTAKLEWIANVGTLPTDTVYVECDLGENFATIVPGETFEIPLLTNYKDGPIIERDYYWVTMNGNRVVTTRVGSFTDTTSFRLYADSITHLPNKYQLKYSERYRENCNNIPTQTRYINVVLIPNLPPVIACPAVTNDYACINDIPAPYANYNAFVAAGGTVTDDQQDAQGNYAIDANSLTMQSEDVDDSDCHHTTVTRTYTIKDLAGNESEPCTQVFVVNDSLAPVLTNMPYSFEAALDVNGGDCQYRYPDFDEYLKANSLVSDNCTSLENLTIEQDYSGPIFLNENSQSLPVKVTVTDACGNKVERMVTVTAPAQLTAYSEVLYEETCVGNDGAATITAIGGTPKRMGAANYYLFSCATNWSTSATLSDMSASGTYTVTVTDDKGCQATVNPVVTMVNDDIQVIIDSVDAGCLANTQDGTITYTVRKPRFFTITLDGVLDDIIKRAGQYQLTNLSDGIHELKVEDVVTGCVLPITVEVKPDSTLLVVSANDEEWIYDGNVHSNPSYTVVYGESVVNANVASGSSVTLPNGDVLTATVEGSITDVGTNDNIVRNITIMRGTLNVNCRYNMVSDTGKLTIIPAAVTVTAQNASKVYGETDPTFSATVTGLLNGDDESLISYTLVRQVGENVGTYNIAPMGEAIQGNYAVTYVMGTLSITPATATVTADAKTKVYGAIDPVLTATVSGLQFNDAPSVINYSMSRTEGENVGKYVITPSGAAAQGNYNVVYVNDTLTIQQLSINVTIAGNTSTVVYNGTSQQLTGFVAVADNSLYNVDSVSDNHSAVISGTDVGQYFMNLDAANFSNKDANFDVQFNVASDGWIKITPITNAIVTITEHSATVDYNGQQQTLTGYDVTSIQIGGQSTTLYTEADFTFSGDSTISGTDADTYNMGLNSTDFANTNNNFANVTFNIVDGQLVIKPIDVTVTITEHSATVDYNGQQQTLTGYDVTSIQFNGQNTTLYTDADFTFSGDSTISGTNAGTYEMGLNSTDFANTNNNFGTVTFVIVNGQLVIKPIDVTVTITEHSATVDYNGQQQTLTGYDVTSIQFNGQNTTLYTDADFTFSGDSTISGINAGTYEMGLNSTDFTNMNNNFGTVTFVIVNGQLVIKPIDVTVTITEHSATVDYNGQQQTLTGYDVTSIQFNGQNTTLYTDADFTFSGDSTISGTNAGTYEMGLNSTDFTNTNNNFGTVTFVIVNGQLVIKPIDVTVTITEHSATVDYNGQQQTLTGYDVTSIQFNGQNTTLYTDADFTFSGDSTISGINAGTYEMGLNSTDFTNTNNNFGTVTFVIVNGQLVIKPIDVTVTITEHSATVDYNGQQQTLTGYDVTSIQFNGQNTTLYTDADFTFSGDSTVSGTDAGTYNMGLNSTDFANTNNNFGTVTFVIVDGQLVIKPIDVTVTITEHSATVDYNGQQQMVTGYDMSPSTPLYTTADFTFSGDSTVSGMDAGTYYMTLNVSDFVNTSGNFANVTFVIEDGQLVIKPVDVTVKIVGNNSTKVYDGHPHTVTGYEVTSIEIYGQSTTLYTEADFTFSGEATATQQNVGRKNMGLHESQFANTNNNFGNVTFNVTDGYQMVIVPGPITVTITGKKDTLDYNGNLQTISGYAISSSDTLYTPDNIMFSGDSTVSGTVAGTYVMTLNESDFANINTNFDDVTFVVHDGELVIRKVEVVVTIEGTNSTDGYDGEAHTVTGYTMTSVPAVYTENDYTFTGRDTATRTLFGTTYMGLTKNQFTNTNENFSRVTFNVTDGYQTISPREVTVNIKGASDTADYNGQPHTVTEYEVTSIQIDGQNTTLYTVADFTFSGEATASQTDAGTAYMGLSESQFTNQNENFSVTFHVTDGFQTVNPIDVTVTITEHNGEFNYDGEEHMVSGYDVTSIQIDGENTTLYTVEDFTFSGDSIVRGTNATTYPMTLSADDFTNTNSNFAVVTFNIVDGKMVIKPINVTVTITEHSGEFDFDGEEHTVSGFDVTSIQIGGESTTLYTANDFTFNGDSMVNGSYAGTYAMDLKPMDFTNTNSNFATVYFNIVDGQMVIKPIDVTVTITEHSATVDYNGAVQKVTGYDFSASTPLYTTADFTFSGDSTVSGKNAGTYDMNLSADHFENISGNFANVTFNIENGQLVIKPIDVTVTITEHSAEVDYNGEVQTVKGYDVEVSTPLYTTADFTFSGDSTVSGKNAGTYDMTLSADNFTNTNNNFANVTFIIVDGQLVIKPISVTVTITEHSGEADYDGEQHTVTGYNVTSIQIGGENTTLYTEDDFTFGGDSTVSGTAAGTYDMGLTSTDFTNTNDNFANVIFNIVNGQLVINPIDVTVTITEHSGVTYYDGQSHTVTGYDVTSIQIGGQSTTLYTDADFTFTGDSTVSGTEVGIYNMGLTETDFTNQNNNFANVTFVIVNGQLEIKPINVTVTITEHSGEVVFDGNDHVVTGFDVTSIQLNGQNTNLYTAADFVFTGDSTVHGTNVGGYDMELEPEDFTNTNVNFENVTFIIVDGQLVIKPVDVTVTITEHNGEVDYDGQLHKVTGYDVTSIQIGGQNTTLYTDADFTFSGDSTVSGTNADTYDMDLKSTDFTNTNDNFGTVTFNIVNGQLVIKPIDVTVTITEHSGEVSYNGSEQMVTGYDVIISNPLYTVADFTFKGKDTASGTNAGTYEMELSADDFSNTSSNFANVTFNIVDGQLVIGQITASVTIKGKNDTRDYDGEEHTVTGYIATANTDLYDVENSIIFSGTATASQTIVGTTYMGLANNQFANGNPNFSQVTFEVTEDGYQTINYAAVTVTVIGHYDTAFYDAMEHEVSDYEFEFSNDAYSSDFITYTGTAYASRREAGVTYMGIDIDQFANTNIYFNPVNFVLRDGYQVVVIPDSMVVVRIKGHVDTLVYNGAEQAVTGYDVVEIIPAEYPETDFTLEAPGRAARTDVGTTMMGLSPDQFVNHNPRYNHVVFEITDGSLTVTKRPVTLTGETSTLVYNASQQTITNVTADNIVPGHSWTINYKASGKEAGDYDGEFIGENLIKSGNTNVTDNYDITLETGRLTISKKALTVSNPATPLTKVYDGTPFSVDYNILQFNGLEGNDAITSGSITTDSYRAGTYLCSVGNRWATTAVGEAVTSGFGPSEVTRNYAVQFNVTLVISPRQLTVTVLDSAKIFDGQPLTQDRYVITNLAETDQAVVTTSGSQTNPGTGVSVVETLEITHDGEDAIDNYRVTRVNGRLLVVSESSDFTCPDPVTVILNEGTSDTIVPLRVLGPITHGSVEDGDAIITNNLDEINPMNEGVHVVTWNLVSVTDGELMASCEQAVVVEYTPCEAVTYHNYTYPAKRIGSQCWLTENLRNTEDASGNEIANYHAYRDDAANLDKFGYLYSWYSTVGISEGNNATMPITQIGDNGEPYVQGICPNGWAVCSYDDYSELNMTVGDALLLKDAGEQYWRQGSNGVTPNSGFNTRGGGWFNSLMNRYEDRYTGFHVWVSDATPGSSVITGFTINDFCDSSINEQGRKTDMRSVRCIRKVYINE